MSIVVVVVVGVSGVVPLPAIKKFIITSIR